MDPLERQYDPEEVIRRAIEARLSRVWTAIPGIVQSFNRAKLTIEVQPTINGRLKSTAGVWSSFPLPKLVDVPVVFPSGGGVSLVFDLAAGDEVLVIFSSRCIDDWWAQGGVGDPTEFRMHNISDGMAIPGLHSVPRAFPSHPIDAGVCRLRTDDDSAYFEFNPTAKTMNAVFPGGITLNGVTIDSTGNLTSPKTITGQQEVVAKTGGSAVHLSTHTHPSNGQPPTPGS